MYYANASARQEVKEGMKGVYCRAAIPCFKIVAKYAKSHGPQIQYGRCCRMAPKRTMAQASYTMSKIRNPCPWPCGEA